MSSPVSAEPTGAGGSAEAGPGGPAGQFSPYEKISQSTASLAKIRTNNTDGRWVVTEKVHGANFQVAYTAATPTTEATVKFGRRNGPLAPGEDFFGFATAGLGPTLAEHARTVHAALTAAWPRVATRLGSPVPMARAAGGEVPAPPSTVCVYGELFGGGYPGMETPRGIQLVQTGIHYCPDLRFYAFDITVEGPNLPRSYVAYDDCIEAFQQCGGLLYAQPLFIGKMNQALNYKIGFDSTLPARLGLPALPPGTNKAEGVVVKPVVAAFAEGKDPTSAGSRVIVKVKIPEFSEKQYSQAVKRQEVAGAGGTAGEESWLQYELLAHVTEQRLNNVVSKTGPCDPADKAKCKMVLAALIQDVIAEFGEYLHAEAPDHAGLVVEAPGPGGGGDLTLTQPALLEAMTTACKELILGYLKKR